MLSYKSNYESAIGQHLITNPECAKTYTDDNFRIIGQARSSLVCQNNVAAFSCCCKIIVRLHWDQTAAVRTESEVSTESEIKKGYDKVVCCHQVFSIYPLKW